MRAEELTKEAELFKAPGDAYVHIELSGTEDEYLMTRPVIYALSGDSFGIVAEYQMSIPFVMFGREIAEISVPTKIVSKYTEK